ncbi:PEP-CTERM system histidine kinase PrsK [Aquincola sp. S2]|uniref:histidine kinase n=1 Tax=Pseudaquabacterium terrae TaxID=2732868 RepID=A0ABX2EC41_9BURK|nr:XrtA/PEP-CTERM system histidine kinase PrsK [Aquabacterium terrae]NRF66480.1 PEP-CTERM system histidine kinase PrsK [Aquabacterium terrae]
MDFAPFGFGLAAVLNAAFAIYLLRSGHLGSLRDRPAAAFLAAVTLTSVWGVAAATDHFSDWRVTADVAAGLDLLRSAAWLTFLLALLRPATAVATGSGDPRSSGALLPVAAGLVALAVVFRAGVALGYPDLYKAALGTALALGVLGLVLLEQLFRNQAEESRWNAKPVCLGLGFSFAYDVYIHSEALMFGRFDADALSVRGAVYALTTPLLFVASRRQASWISRLKVSRSAAFYSATLLLIGAYLLLIAAVGYYVRYFGGEWGRALQLALLFAALLMLAVLLLSGSLRARLRVFLSKNFFSYRYDYRQEWLRFTAMLSTKTSPQEVGVLVVHGLADMVECPAGSLWSRGLGGDRFVQTARWNMPAAGDSEPVDSPFCGFMREKEWIVDIDEFRAQPRRYGDLAVPLWLATSPSAWLVVPLLVGEQLIGFVVLSRPRTAVEPNWEVRDLLKTAARQAAGFIAQMQATEALLEVRKFDAFNRMSAFVVHDLKNIITQLSLMLKNAERLRDNPEFQQDMLLTVESSLEKMRQMMLQLREGAKPVGGAAGVELAPMLQRLEAMVRGRGRRVELEIVDPIATRGHEERLERVIGHLVQNALDATPPSGKVWVRLQQASGRVMVVVGDTGKGMTQEFVQTRLFRPFNTTKDSGMGIGAYESFQYIKELGGSIDVQSEVGRGSVVTILLPLFDAHKAADLQMASDDR